MNKIFMCIIVTSLFINNSFANDFLAKVSNGILSDSSNEVRILNKDEEKEIVGGYMVGL
ncbi:hypothetical protein [Helicobacter sp. WB40]|uniref:hypothetical protein n=1 Tax=Helicobacter sp. WB40 TaxID=3004130 RepID=UPI0022EBFFC4|nr:hypothetical protein [Helicobacter sp. WB40]MDA3966870.1 hypothetical protein [Helicobacter sp. WB40]